MKKIAHVSLYFNSGKDGAARGLIQPQLLLAVCSGLPQSHCVPWVFMEKHWALWAAYLMRAWEVWKLEMNPYICLKGADSETTDAF